jgi:hypothetical protein
MMEVWMTWKVERILSKNRPAGKVKTVPSKNESCPSFIHFGIDFGGYFGIWFGIPALIDSFTS